VKKAIGKNEVIKLLLEGWELASSRGFHGNFWMQKEIGSSPDSRKVSGKAMAALFQQRILEKLPKREDDPWYLTRYGLLRVVRDGKERYMYEVLGVKVKRDETDGRAAKAT
jgi:hypothetical protein